MKNVLTKVKNNLKSERGSEILQVILIAGILLVLIVTLFYPQMQTLFTNVINKISTWFDGAGSAVFRA
jgi:predicted PurR-regulated permease PerM